MYEIYYVLLVTTQGFANYLNNIFEFIAKYL